MRFKVIQGHHFLYQSKLESPYATLYLVYTLVMYAYILSYLAPFPTYRGLLITFLQALGVPLFNALVCGEFLNSILRKLASKTDILFVVRCKACFDIVNH